MSTLHEKSRTIWGIGVGRNNKKQGRNIGRNNGDTLRRKMGYVQELSLCSLRENGNTVWYMVIF